MKNLVPCYSVNPEEILVLVYSCVRTCNMVRVVRVLNLVHYSTAVQCTVPIADGSIY
eukprot:SAG31_NODE_1910_length_6945_cov_45.108384_1_plen_57_part_00